MGNFLSTSQEGIPEISESESDTTLSITGFSLSWPPKRIENFLKKLDIKFKKIVKNKGQEYFVIYFESKEDKLFAYSRLYKTKFNNENIDVEHGDYIPPENLYAKHDEIKTYNKTETDTLIDRMLPYRYMDIRDVASLKYNEVKSLSNEIDVNIPLKVLSPDLNDTLRHQRFDLLFGYSPSGKVAIGYVYGSRNRALAIDDSSIKLPEDIDSICKSFASFVDKSVFTPYDRVTKTGKFYKLSIRISSQNKKILTFCTIGSLPMNIIEQIENLFNKRVDSLIWAKLVNENFDHTCRYQVLSNKATVSEKICDCTFDITPFTVFPGIFSIFVKYTNEIKKYINPNTILVDLCCGEGINTAILASSVKRVIGVDSDEYKINFAQSNASLNHITNIFHVLSSPKTVLNGLVNNLGENDEIVCLLDASVPGKHSEAVQAVKNCSRVNKFLYAHKCCSTVLYDYQRWLNNFKIVDSTLFDTNPQTTDYKYLAIFVNSNIE